MIPENEKNVKITPHGWKAHITPSRIISAFLALVFLLILVSFLFLHRTVNLPENRVYEVVPGVTSREIAYDLARKQIIRFPRLFNFYLSLKRLDTKLQAGRYEFPESRMSLREVAAFLASGARAKEVEFAVPEGYTMVQIAALLEGKALVLEEDFVEKAKSEFQISNVKFQINGQFLMSKTLEGYLFPDTYRIYENATGDEILAKMLQNFEKKVVLPLRVSIVKSGRSLTEIITMASILEKEVRTAEDMKKVADILWRRLDADWALEVDATLKYEIGGSSPSLTYEEVQIDSPYNTYRYKSLPPTPIGNPGLQSITAALYPEPNEYWFYLSKPDGETVFSKTLQEHNRNKVRYLR